MHLDSQFVLRHPPWESPAQSAVSEHGGVVGYTPTLSFTEPDRDLVASAVHIRLSPFGLLLPGGQTTTPSWRL